MSRDDADMRTMGFRNEADVAQFTRSVTHITETEQRLTRTLRTTTEALTQVTAERDALRDALEDALEALENEGPVFWQEVQDKARAVLKGKS